MIDTTQFASLLFSAFLIGLLGAGHCATMCGGLVSAFTLSGANRRPLSWFINYNVGRIFSYMVAGGVAGALGSASLHLFEIETARSLARALVAFTLIAVGLYLCGWPQLLAPIEKLGYRMWSKISPRVTHLLRVRSGIDALRFGLVWGWLPCGLVYSAVLSATTTGDALMGAQVMLFFGLGTLPALLSLGLLANQIRSLARNPVFRRISGSTLSLLGVYTLLAGAHH
ncbi:MAG: sulfite exporter TauE/SafE family protein [Pseudomonadota bacterium]